MAQLARQLTPDLSEFHRFGAALRRCRERQQLSQRALGQLVHASGDLIGKVEKAERRPTAALIKACDEVLHANGELLSYGAALERASQMPSGVPTGDTPLYRGSGVEIADLGEHRELLDGWYDLLASLSASGNSTGYTGMALTARVQVRAAEGLSSRTTGATRRDLFKAQALWSEFLSWIDDQNATTNAATWLQRAHDDAVQAEAPMLVGYVLMRQSQQAVEQANPIRALALANEALQQGRLPARIQALILIRQAQAYALGGDELACATKIGLAHRLAGRSDPDAGSPIDIGAHCTPAYVVAHEAQCRLLLGQSETAVSLYESLLRHWPDCWRVDEALWRASLAAAHAANGDPEQAAAEAGRALTIAVDTRSARAIRSLSSTAIALRRHQAIPDAVDFLAAYRGATLGACKD